MNYLNIECAFLDSEKFLGSDPIVRATWLCLLRFCAGQENGGLILECESWGCRKWQQMVRVTKDEIAAESNLWRFEGASLRVEGYPIELENKIRAQRKGGKEGAERRWNKPGLKKKIYPLKIQV